MTDEKVLAPDEPSETDVAPPSEADTVDVPAEEEPPETDADPQAGEEEDEPEASEG